MSYKPGDVLKDRYVIQEVLGQGSMGEVYRAEHVTIHRQFAIKLMHVHIAEKADALIRFKREANAAAQLEHPHICQVTDFDSNENGDFYLVMEYLKGETLRNRLEREGTIEIHSVFRIMHDLLCALECAHANGIVHRDVKPENISLINRDERDDYVKLIDFGIAHADKPNDNTGTLTQAGQVYGTPQYLSPEQVMGDPVDLRADLYSCGCTLYEMSEGNPPFNADNYILLLNQHLVVDPPHLKKDIECAHELDEVIQKLLKKRPDERYSSAREVRAALADIANRFYPTLNLRMSQLGANGPAVTEVSIADSPSKSTSVSGQETKPAMASVSNPYINPDEVSLIQTLNGSKNASKKSENTQDSDNQASHTQDDVRHSQKNGLGIAFVVGTVVIVLAVLAFMVFWMQQQSGNVPVPEQTVSSSDPVEVAPPPKTPESAPPESNSPSRDKLDIEIYDTEVISALDPNGYILSDEQIREFAQSECHIAENDPMYQDEAMRAAIEQCAQGNFEEAYKVFDKSKSTYWVNPRFFIMSMICSYAVKRYRDTIRDVLQLVVIAPDAVCIPAVSEIIYSLYEDDNTYVRLRTGLLNLFDQRGTSGALSWLLLMTPCNQHQKRFERLSDSIKVATRTFEEEYNETPLGEAVHWWDNFDSKGKCATRKNVDKIIFNELNQNCHDSESGNAKTDRCAMCYPLWKKRYAETNGTQH